MSAQADPDLTVIPLKHFYWHKWSLYTAYMILWVGFLVALLRVWNNVSLDLLAISIMLLGVGLLIFRGVAFIMNAWVIWSEYVSLREMRNGKE